MNRTTTPIFASLILGLLGALMSGYLSYWALFGPSCNAGPIAWLSCGATQPVKLIGIPTCVYGFFMFTAVVIMSLVALQRYNRKLRTTMLTVATVGTLFSLSLAIYEVFWLEWTTLPACVYGFFFYVGIFVSILISQPRPLSPMTPSTTTPNA